MPILDRKMDSAGFRGAREIANSKLSSIASVSIANGQHTVVANSAGGSFKVGPSAGAKKRGSETRIVPKE